MTLIINGKTYEAGELIAYVENLEKENTELKDYNKKLLQSDIDKQNKIVLLSKKVNDLQKENEEMKAQLYAFDEERETLRKEYAELENDMKTAVSLLERSVEISESITKAEDLLKQWLKLYNTNTVKGIIADTEQFLKEE